MESSCLVLILKETSGGSECYRMMNNSYPIRYVALIGFIAVTYVFTLNSCTKDSGPLYVDPIIPEDTTTVDTVEFPTVSFYDDAVPIFTIQCVQCHPPAAEVNLLPEKAYNSLVNKVSPVYSPSVRVVPFYPDSSVIWHKLINSFEFGIEMPPKGPLDFEDLELIETWILEGALEN